MTTPLADPDGDSAESIAWWEPSQLPGNPAVRPELLADIDAVMDALGTTDDSCCGCPDCCADGCCQGAGGCPCGPAVTPSDGDESTCPCGTPAVFDEMNGWQHADGSISHDDDDESVSDKMGAVAKAADAGPKAPAWPGWELDGPTVAYWAPKVTSAVTLPKARLSQLAGGYLAANPAPAQGQQQGKRDRNAAAAAWLTNQGVTLPLGEIVPGIVSDGYVIGTVSATALVTGEPVDTGGWKPGGPADGLIPAALLASAGQATVTATEAMSDGYRSTMGRTLADGADDGLTVAALGAALAAVLADGTLAASLIGDQVTAASGDAAYKFYCGTPGLSSYHWITDSANPCPVCVANEAQGSIPVGDAFLSGDYNAPIHPNCACAVVPG